MDRRGFLKRLGAVAVAAGLVAVAPEVATPAQAAAPALPVPAAPALAGEVLAPEIDALLIAYDTIPTRGYIGTSISGIFTASKVSLFRPGDRVRSRFADQSPYQRTEILRNSLAKMGAIGDDAFIGGDEDVRWRWEQVRSAVIKGYPQGAGGDYYVKRIIALPPVADVLFLEDEPGHKEWQAVRAQMYEFANRAARVVA